MMDWIRFALVLLSVAGAASAASAVTNLYIATATGGGRGHLYEVDVIAEVVRSAVELPGAPRSVAVDASSGRVYVSVCQQNQVLVFDRDLRQVAERIDVGECPGGISLDPARPYLYVTNGNEQVVPSVSVIDTALEVEINKYPTLFHPSTLVRGAANRLYVASDGGAIDVLDAVSGQRLTDEVPSSRGDAFTALAMSSDGRTLYAGDTGARAIQMVDVAERQSVATLNLPGPPHSIALTRDDRLLLVAVGGVPGSVLVVQPRRLEVDFSIQSSGQPVALAVGDGNEAYVVSDTGDTAIVARLNLETLKLSQIVSVDGTPTAFGSSFVVSIPDVPRTTDSNHVFASETLEAVGASDDGCMLSSPPRGSPFGFMSVVSAGLLTFLQVSRRRIAQRER